MLSARGAIATNVAMVECAGGQNAHGKGVFLLSELEKVWVSVCILARRLLLEGKNVQIPHLGSLWLDERCLIHDTVRYRQRYYVRKVHFGLDASFSLRYGIDSVKTPQVRKGIPYTKVAMADIVGVCAVPAHTAATALKEFIMYIGEGLYCGRTFNLSLPGVGTLIVKKERLMFTVDTELEGDLFECDSRRWPAELQIIGREKLAAERVPASVASSSRPSTARSSSRPTTASSAGTAASTATTSGGPRPVFNPAAPKDRLFADIAKEAARRREAEALRQEEALEDARRQAYIDQRIDAYARRPAHWRDADDYDGYSDAARPHGPYGVNDDRPGTQESVYDMIDEDDDRAEEAPQFRARTRRPDRRDESADAAEPDVEAVEVIETEKPAQPRAETLRAGPTVGRGPAPVTAGKDPELEAILRQEEVFSRPLSRRAAAVNHTSVRDLIYGPPAPVDGQHQKAARPRRVDPMEDNIAVPPQHFTPRNSSENAAGAPKFGRKRYSEYIGTNDDVGTLLKNPFA